MKGTATHLAALFIALASPLTAQASAIFIDESVDGAPVVTYTSSAIVGVAVFRDPSAVMPGSESWTVRVFFAGTTVGADVGQSGVKLIDPNTGLVSDFAAFFNLDSTSHLSGSNPGNSFVEIGVYSSDDTGVFDPRILPDLGFCGVPSSNPHTGNCASTIEDGSFQLVVSNVTTSDGTFDVYLRSSVAAPEPASLALFAVGLAGLGFGRRKNA